MADKFYVDIKVKPYVKQYLINNCGNPVDLTHLPKFNELYKKLVTRPLLRFESLNIPSSECYVRISISHDTFYRYGWQMSRTGQMLFNGSIERELKFFMRTYIASRAALGHSVSQCIRDFQTRFNMPEEVWNFDAIKKDIDRNTEAKKSNDVETFLNELDTKIQRIFLENLSAVGTISNKYKHELSQIR